MTNITPVTGAKITGCFGNMGIASQIVISDIRTDEKAEVIDTRSETAATFRGYVIRQLAIEILSDIIPVGQIQCMSIDELEIRIDRRLKFMAKQQESVKNLLRGF